MRFPYTVAPTGSLGQGLSIGVGVALAMGMNRESRIMNNGKDKKNHDSLFKIHNSSPKVYVLLGDSEVAEGQVWEAVQIATHYKLNNLKMIKLEFQNISLVA